MLGEFHDHLLGLLLPSKFLLNMFTLRLELFKNNSELIYKAEGSFKMTYSGQEYISTTGRFLLMAINEFGYVGRVFFLPIMYLVGIGREEHFLNQLP